MAEFNVKTVSCTSKITAKIEVNIGSLEREYKGNKLDFEKIFTIDSGKGSVYTGEICIGDFGCQQTIKFSNEKMSEPHQKSIQFVIADIQTLRYDMKLVFSGKISKNFNGTTGDVAWIMENGKKRYGCGQYFFADNIFTGKFKAFKAEITVEFEPGLRMIYKEKFKNYVNSCLVFKPDGNGENFQIVCKGEVFGINKSILCNVSPVFERMLANPDLKECRDGLVEMVDTTPETIKAFKNILTLDYIEKEDLSVELLIFADKYDIGFLYKLCQDYLCTAISNENLFDIIKAANDTKDEELMSKSSEFITMNRGSIDIGESPEWKDFCKKNPECAVKILSLMMSKK